MEPQNFAAQGVLARRRHIKKKREKQNLSDKNAEWELVSARMVSGWPTHRN